MPLAILFEYMQNGSLDKLLRESAVVQPDYLDLAQLLLFSLDIAEGMAFLTAQVRSSQWQEHCWRQVMLLRLRATSFSGLFHVLVLVSLATPSFPWSCSTYYLLYTQSALIVDALT